MLGWFHALVDFGLDGPAVVDEAVDGLFVVWFGVFGVGLAVVAVTVAEVDNFFADVVLVVFTDLIDEVVDDDAGVVAWFFEEFVDGAIDGFDDLVDEVEGAFLGD